MRVLCDYAITQPILTTVVGVVALTSVLLIRDVVVSLFWKPEPTPDNSTW